jgi:polyhydroxybutyrate depolymerase
MNSKKNFLLFVLAIFCLYANAQWTNKSYVYQSKTRQYRIYVSPSYNASDPASMVITLHGLGDNMTNFSQLGFNYIADTANIIVVVPQALSDVYAGTAWNSGAGQSGYYPNSAINDVGFLNSLIDTIKANYAIDPSRVYMCGFSMGGFMTERMALQSNTQIAAFASMSGTVGDAITTYAPGRSVPVAHFHGTMDSTVFYVNNTYGIDPVTLINFWVTNNGCNPVPDSSQFSNTATDGITVDLFKYSGSSLDNDVWLFRMNGADHTVLYQPDNDITEIIEIWYFFNRHKNITAGIQTQAAFETNIQVYPNPANSFIDLILPETSEKLVVELFSIQGSCLYSEQVTGSLHQISLDDAKFTNGIYFLRVTGESVNASRRIVIQK